MADRERPDAPARSNCRERLQHEAAAGELRVGDGQSARPEPAAAPQRNVEVKDSRAPTPAGTAPDLAFKRLEARQQGRGLKVAFDQSNGIGEIAACPAVGG